MAMRRAAQQAIQALGSSVSQSRQLHVIPSLFLVCQLVQRFQFGFLFIYLILMIYFDFNLFVGEVLMIFQLFDAI